MSVVEFMVMVHVHCPLSMTNREKRKDEKKKLCELEFGVKTTQDQRPKRARLLTRFRKGDPEGRRDHFHFDQKFCS